MSMEQEKVFSRQGELDLVVEAMRRRGVRVGDYSLGVRYDPDNLADFGHVSREMEGRFLMPIYVTERCWMDTVKEGLDLVTFLTMVVEHELVHEIRKSRIMKRLTYPLGVQEEELIAYGIQLRPEYQASRRSWFPGSVSTLDWWERLAQEHYAGHIHWLQQRSASGMPHADLFLRWMNAALEEIEEGEYLLGLGVER